MTTIKINNISFFVKNNISILEACKYVGLTLPRFCYHESLSLAGNCRMCLVELLNSSKPTAACVSPVMYNMQIFIDSSIVKKVRENILESLLLNHPLDCPICDQGGECDLQDQTKMYGNNLNRFFLNKKISEDKNCGPLVKTIMTRCIQCTRCVRFSSEIAGTAFFGLLNRGLKTEIGYYASAPFFSSEISGNVIDLCPVGALTNKTYAFKSRPWELTTIQSIDLTDSTGSNIFIQTKAAEIVRITPKINKYININIISDAARFSFDANTKNRLLSLYEYNKNNKRFESTSLFRLLVYLTNSFLSRQNILFLINETLDNETIQHLKLLCFKCKNLKVKSITHTNNPFNCFTSTNFSKIYSLNNASKICLIFSINLTIEASIINVKLRLKSSTSDYLLINFGPLYSSNNSSMKFLNYKVFDLVNIISSKNSQLSRIIIKYIAPIIFINCFKLLEIMGILKHFIPTLLFYNIGSFCNSSGIVFFNISGVTKHDILTSSLVYCLNLDTEFFLAKILSYVKDFSWINSHGSKLAFKATYIIPNLSAYENENSFLNLEFKNQSSKKIIDCKTVSVFTSKLKHLLVNSLDRNKSFFFNREVLQKPELFQNVFFKFQFNLSRLVGLSAGLLVQRLAKILKVDSYGRTSENKASPTLSICSKTTRNLLCNFRLNG
jgi:hypothetical protein